MARSVSPLVEPPSLQTYYRNLLLGESLSPYEWTVIGRSLFIMSIEAVAYAALLLRLEDQQRLYSRLEPCLVALCGTPEPSLALSTASKRGIGVAALLVIMCLFRGAVLTSAFLLIVAALTTLAWERRLRRLGQTADARARAELTAAEGGEGFVEESDVAAERARIDTLLGAHGGVARSAAAEEAVIISNLRKVYPGRGKAAPKVAVVDLSLGVPRAECFGFLGVNGAGKTTTMSILTGDALPTAGRAWIDGHHVVHERQRVQQRMGYCPQADPLLELMTVSETLATRARPPLHMQSPLLRRLALTPLRRVRRW